MTEARIQRELSKILCQFDEDWLDETLESPFAKDHLKTFIEDILCRLVNLYEKIDYDRILANKEKAQKEGIKTMTLQDIIVALEVIASKKDNSSDLRELAKKLTEDGLKSVTDFRNLFDKYNKIRVSIKNLENKFKNREVNLPYDVSKDFAEIVKLVEF